MKIIAVHLFNDYSGSPKVLGQLVNDWLKKGLKVSIVSSNSEGFLSNTNADYYAIAYIFSTSKLIRLINYFKSQLITFYKVLSISKKNDIVYVNTVLPFGAALAGKIKGCKVIYHVHETSIKPVLLKKLLFKIVEYTADEIIYVSNYLYEKENIKNVTSHIVYNAIENSFLEIASQNRNKKEIRKNVLMVCSLKDYKGIPEYVKLVELNLDLEFKIVVNASQNDTHAYFKKFKSYSNLLIYSTQTNLHPFYQWADVILNLSRPNEWIETFGLTILEGMAYGLPAIVPPVGGITELIEDDINGFKIDGKDSLELSNKLNAILKSKEDYERLSAASIEKIEEFKEDAFFKKCFERIINSMTYIDVE